MTNQQTKGQSIVERAEEAACEVVKNWVFDSIRAEREQAENHTIKDYVATTFIDLWRGSTGSSPDKTAYLGALFFDKAFSDRTAPVVGFKILKEPGDDYDFFAGVLSYRESGESWDVEESYNCFSEDEFIAKICEVISATPRYAEDNEVTR